MHRILPSRAAILSLATLAVVATLAPTTRYSGFEAVSPQERIGKDQAYSVPLILAQGRCRNGRCY